MLENQLHREKGILLFIAFYTIVTLSNIAYAHYKKHEIYEEKIVVEKDKKNLLDDIVKEKDRATELEVEKELLLNSLEEYEEELEKHKSKIIDLEKENKQLNNNIKEYEKEKKRRQNINKQRANNKSNVSKVEKKVVEATAYTARCDGCIGITKTGTNVKDTIYHPSGHKIVAVDPKIIPLGSIIKINNETYIADDIGGAIKGNRIDILMKTKEEAYKFGRREVEIEIVK